MDTGVIAGAYENVGMPLLKTLGIATTAWSRVNPRDRVERHPTQRLGDAPDSLQ